MTAKGGRIFRGIGNVFHGAVNGHQPQPEEK
jgi:hypothetical protein